MTNNTPSPSAAVSSQTVSGGATLSPSPADYPVHVYVVQLADSGRTFEIPFRGIVAVRLPEPALGGTWVIRSQDPTVLAPIADPGCPDRGATIDMLVHEYGLSQTDAENIAGQTTASCTTSSGAVGAATFMAIKPGQVEIDGTLDCRSTAPGACILPGPNPTPVVHLAFRVSLSVAPD